MNFQNRLKALGYAGKSLMLRMGVTGDGKNRQVSRYKSDNQASIVAECNVYQMCGYAGVVHIWDGAVDQFINQSMLGMWQECQKRKMLFAVMLDQWIAKGSDPTGEVIAALNSSDFQKVINSSCYLPEKYLMEFSLTENDKVNIPAVQKAFPAMPILSEDTGFSWIKIPPVKANPVKVMSAFVGFNDGGRPVPNGIEGKWDGVLRNWSAGYWGDGKAPNRVVQHEGGNFFMDQIENMLKTTPYILIGTGDDYEEGTAVLPTLAAMCLTRI